MADIAPKTLEEFIDNFVSVMDAESDLPLATQVGSVLRAMAAAASANDTYTQSQIVEANLDANLDTCEGDSLVRFVNQYVPPFTGKILAKAATTAPLPPTTLVAAATNTYLLVASIFGLQLTQTLSLSRLGFSATGIITTLEPTTLLTFTAAYGATALNVVSTTGMFPGAKLRLTQAGFDYDVTIVNVVNANVVNITAIQPPVFVDFHAGTTVTLINVVRCLAGLTLAVGTLLTDLTSGTFVRATSLIQGVRFYRNTASPSTVIIPVGTQLQNKQGIVLYTVTADVANPDYDPGTSTYILPANATEVYVRATASVAGAGSNLLANTLTVLTSAVSGIDGVTNPYEINNGTNDESDAVLKARFRDFIGGRDSGTILAVTAAIEAVSSALQFKLTENVADNGVTFEPGHLLVVVGDANGFLTFDDYTAVVNAVNLSRPITVGFTVKGPVIITPTVAAVLAYKPGFNSLTVALSVQSAIFNMFRNFPAGSAVVFNAIVETIMLVDGVADILRLTTNTDPAHLIANDNGFDNRTPGYIVGLGPTPITPAAAELVRPPLLNISVS